MSGLSFYHDWDGNGALINIGENISLDVDGANRVFWEWGKDQDRLLSPPMTGQAGLVLNNWEVFAWSDG
jgi:hypothetical protein